MVSDSDHLAFTQESDCGNFQLTQAEEAKQKWETREGLGRHLTADSF